MQPNSILRYTKTRTHIPGQKYVQLLESTYRYHQNALAIHIVNLFLVFKTNMFVTGESRSVCIVVIYFRSLNFDHCAESYIESQLLTVAKHVGSFLSRNSLFLFLYSRVLVFLFIVFMYTVVYVCNEVSMILLLCFRNNPTVCYLLLFILDLILFLI